MSITADSASRVSRTSVENRILLSESPSCCPVAIFILKDYCSLVLVVPTQTSVSAKPGNGVNDLPWMLGRRMSFMQRGALIPVAYNAQLQWWPEKPEAGCHLSQLLYAPSFISFDIFKLVFPKLWLRILWHLFSSCLLASILAEYKTLFYSCTNSFSSLLHFINKSMYRIILQKLY